MAAVSFDKVVSGSFLRRFQGLASGAASSANPLKNNASSVTLSDGLRLGARTFATAVQALNATISFVNISRNTLTNLEKVVGQMVDLAQESSERGLGSDGRADLDLRFKKLVTKFRQAVANTQIGDDDYLSREGLANILQKIGLDPETSLSVSRLFDAFITPTSEDKLASEFTKERRPLSIPQSVFDAGRARNPYRLMNVSNSDGGILDTGDQAGIAPTTNIFRNTDSASGSNPGELAVFAVDQNGTRTTQNTGTLSGANDLTELMAVNELNIDSNSIPGYSVVKSTGNLFNNYNPDNVENLFLLDETGKVVSQITPFSAGSTYQMTAVDISDDGLTYLIATDDGAGNYQVFQYEITGIGDDPSGYSLFNVGTYTSPVTEVQLSADGDYALVRRPSGDRFDLYQSNGAGTWTVHGGDGNGGIVDAGIEATFVSTNSAGLGTSVVFLLPGSGELQRLNWNDTSANTISGVQADGALSNLAGLAYDNSGNEVPYIAYQDGDQIRLYSLNGTAADAVDLSQDTSDDAYSLGNGASVSRLSLAQRADGRVDIGLVASMPDTGDSDTELYRLIFNTQSLAGRQQGFTTSEPNKILDYSLATRPDAYRALQDLTKLKEQITKNIKALDKMTTYIGQSIDFIRGTGLAFLDLADKITSEEDADAVAARLRLEIRKNIKGSLAQAENLEAIVVAALTYGQS